MVALSAKREEENARKNWKRRAPAMMAAGHVESRENSSILFTELYRQVEADRQH